MRSQRLPNDVLQEIIRSLAQEKQHLRKFLGLSSFCREEAKKHIFSLINLGFGVQRSKAEFVSLFSEEDGPTSYVRALIILFTHDDWADEAIQAGIHKILPKLKNLTSIHIISTSALEWTSLPPLSIRSAIRDSSQHLPLRDLTICLLRQFPVDDIAYLPHLRRLNILGCRLTIDNTNSRHDCPATLRSHNLEALQIRRSTAGTFLESVISPLMAKDSRNNFLLPLANLKSLDIDICSPIYFESAISLMKQHNIQGLEDLTIHILLDEWPSIAGPNDCSQWLDQIILPQNPTLRKLRVETETMTENHDPFAGSFDTLGQVGPDNVVETIHIAIRVQTDYVCTTGEAWCALARVLTNGNWKRLKEVKVSVVVLMFMRMQGDLVQELVGLRETHLKPLFTQTFNFDYEVDVQPI